MCPSPALSLRGRRVAWALWCPTSCPPPCVACPLSQPSPTPPRASPAAPLPQMDPPAFPPKSQSPHPLPAPFVSPFPCLVVCDVVLPSLQRLPSLNTDFVFAQIQSTVCLYDCTSFCISFSAPDYPQAVPCPVPAIAGPRFCPARRKTTGLRERTGRSGVSANPRS